MRYCEIIPVTQKGNKLTAWVYNTLGLNDCPAAEWDALTEEQVNEAYGSVSAKLNGPRYWVIDKLAASGSSTTGERFTFGGIEMELRADIDTKLREDTVGEEFYAPNEVQRDTVYTYKAGKPVYELTSPEGDVYIMQSYAQVKDKSLTIDDLASLGSKLSLPERAMSGPALQTIGPSVTRELSIQFGSVEVRHRDPRSAGSEKEVRSRQAAELRRTTGRDTALLEKPQGKNELRLSDEFVLRLACDEKDALG